MREFKVRPILFQPEMVKALLDGRKTQTRRQIKHQPSVKSQESKLGENGWWMWRVAGFGWAHDQRCPYGEPGDLLYVRETWREGEDGTRAAPSVYYKADETYHDGAGWKPSIHMPRKYSRLTLRITDVRVERVQDISYRDIAAEGIRVCPVHQHDHTCCFFLAEEWVRLWNKINGNWDANPWVWVVTFEVIKGNVDEVLKEAA